MHAETPTDAFIGSPFALLRLPDGTLSQVRSGDLIGRRWTCAVVLSDERVSEVHAMVSLRGGDLRLLCLRGAVAIGGTLVDDPILEVGQVLQLAPDVEIMVEELRLPQAVLALSGEGIGSRVLTGVCSLFLETSPRLAAGRRADASAWFFDDGRAWYLRRPGHPESQLLQAGDTLEIDGWTGTVLAKPLAQVGAPTLRSEVYVPLRIEAFYDTVRFFRTGTLVTQLHGLGARLVCELVEFDQPVAWEIVAKQLWPGTDDRWVLRRRWDTLLRRVRTSLAEAGLRSDLLCSDGTGSVAIVAYPSDELVRESP